MWLSWLARRNDDALELSEKALEFDPSFGWTYFWMGLPLEQKSRYEDAIAAFRKASEHRGGLVQAQAALAHALAMAGRRGEAEDALRQIEHPSPQRYVGPYAAAIVYTVLGEPDRAFNWLEQAVNEGASWLTMFGKSDPRLDPLRSDPRFVDVLRRMRLDR